MAIKTLKIHHKLYKASGRNSMYVMVQPSSAIVFRYTRGVDRFDREMVLSAYHPDAIDDHGEFVGSAEGFVNWAFALHDAGQIFTQHHLTNHVCEIDGDTAHAETY